MKSSWKGSYKSPPRKASRKMIKGPANMIKATNVSWKIGSRFNDVSGARKSMISPDAI
jgi:hypothetical protein